MRSLTLILSLLVLAACDREIVYVYPDAGPDVPADDAGALEDATQPPVTDAGTDALVLEDAGGDIVPTGNSCEQPYRNDCAWLEDEHRVRRGTEWVTIISACAACKRIEHAFYERAFELGCCEPFPLTSCPLEGQDTCYAAEADDRGAWLRQAINCTDLSRRALDTSDIVYSGVCESGP